MKKKTLVLETSSTGADGYNADCDYAAVELTESLACRLLARIKTLRDVNEKDREAYEIYYWDDSPQYYSGDPKKYRKSGKKVSASTECDQLVVRMDEIAWMCYPKHTDVTITTEHVPVKELNRMVSPEDRIEEDWQKRRPA